MSRVRLFSFEIPSGMKWKIIQFKQYKSRARDILRQVEIQI